MKDNDQDIRTIKGEKYLWIGLSLLAVTGFVLFITLNHVAVDPPHEWVAIIEDDASTVVKEGEDVYKVTYIEGSTRTVYRFDVDKDTGRIEFSEARYYVEDDDIPYFYSSSKVMYDYRHMIENSLRVRAEDE
jgi:hypothetical protein